MNLYSKITITKRSRLHIVVLEIVLRCHFKHVHFLNIPLTKPFTIVLQVFELEDFEQYPVQYSTHDIFIAVLSF